jgi:hypothetical protein
MVLGLGRSAETVLRLSNNQGNQEPRDIASSSPDRASRRCGLGETQCSAQHWQVILSAVQSGALHGPATALLGSWLMDSSSKEEGGLWRRIEPRLPMINQGRPND